MDRVDSRACPENRPPAAAEVTRLQFRFLNAQLPTLNETIRAASRRLLPLFRYGLGAIALLTAVHVFAADPPVATNRYEFRAEHHRDGIGKFYLGREIAHVMGHQAADWLERPERDEEEHTEKLVEQLKVKPGDVIADIGAGTGYFSRRLAKKTGP